MVTPHIDQALAHFRQRTRIPVQSAISSSTELASSSEPEKAELHKIYSEIRIKNIEDQISQILQKVTFFFSCDCTEVLFIKTYTPFTMQEFAGTDWSFSAGMSVLTLC